MRSSIALDVQSRAQAIRPYDSSRPSLAYLMIAAQSMQRRYALSKGRRCYSAKSIKLTIIPAPRIAQHAFETLPISVRSRRRQHQGPRALLIGTLQDILHLEKLFNFVLNRHRSACTYPSSLTNRSPDRLAALFNPGTDPSRIRSSINHSNFLSG